MGVKGTHETEEGSLVVRTAFPIPSSSSPHLGACVHTCTTASTSYQEALCPDHSLERNTEQKVSIKGYP